MRRALRSKRKKKVVTPGGRQVWHVLKRRPSHAKCGKCGAKLNRARLGKGQLCKLPKSSRRPERPLPHLCPRCMKEEIKARVRL